MKEKKMGKRSLDGFEKFTGGRRYSKQPNFSILKGGRVGVNKAAHERFFREHPFVEIYYNRKSKELALRLLKESSGASYEVKVLRRSVVQIPTAAFFKYYEIDVSKRRNTEIIELDENRGIIFLKIKEE